MTLAGPIAFWGTPGTGEMLVICVVALMLFGSKNLPKIARNIGKAMEEFKRASRQVSMEIMREEPPAPRPLPRLDIGKKPEQKQDQDDQHGNGQAQGLS